MWNFLINCVVGIFPHFEGTLDLTMCEPKVWIDPRDTQISDSIPSPIAPQVHVGVTTKRDSVKPILVPQC